jgi:hypothetical protein
VRPYGRGGSRHHLPASVGASSSRDGRSFPIVEWSSDTSDAPSPHDRRPFLADFGRAIEAASPTPIVKCAGVLQPETSSSGGERFSRSLLVPIPVFDPGRVQLSTSFHSAEVTNPRKLGPVRSPQPQPRLASRARRRSPDSATFSTRNPGTPPNDRPSHETMLSLASSARPDHEPSEL